MVARQCDRAVKRRCNTELTRAKRGRDPLGAPSGYRQDMRRPATFFAACIVSAFTRIASAQVTPAAGSTPPDDTPSIRVGVTIYTDFTYQPSPEVTDTDGNVVNPSSFNVTRSYINITGQLSHVVAFRITPDVVRESGLVTHGAGSTITSDRLVLRGKA